METDPSLNSLIAKAASIVGSEYRLAKELGIPQTHISAWKSGERNCVPSDRARLAGFAREDAVQELVRSTIDSAKGLKRVQLQQVLGKLLHQTGEATVTVLAGLASLIYSAAQFDLLRCIKCGELVGHDPATVK